MRCVALVAMTLLLSSQVAIAREVCEPFPPPPAKPGVETPATPPKPRPLPTEFNVVSGGEAGTPIVLLGDSMISGGGGTTVEQRLPTLLSTRFEEPRSYRMYAIGGQTSTTLTNLFLPVQLPEEAVVIIWMGRNNVGDPDRVLADIRAVVDKITPRNYLILPITHGLARSERPGTEKGAAIDNLNERLATTFPGHFVRNELACADYADNLHLNGEGNLKVAKSLYAEMVERGW